MGMLAIRDDVRRSTLLSMIINVHHSWTHGRLAHVVTFLLGTCKFHVLTGHLQIPRRDWTLARSDTPVLHHLLVGEFLSADLVELEEREVRLCLSFDVV